MENRMDIKTNRLALAGQLCGATLLLTLISLPLLCCLLVPLGYFLFETVLLTAPVAAVNVLPNAFQAVVGASLGTLIGRHLKKLYKRKD